MTRDRAPTRCQPDLTDPGSRSGRRGSKPSHIPTASRAGPRAALVALLLLAGACTADVSDVEEDRIEHARAAIPGVFDALGPVALDCAADASREGLRAGRMLWRIAADRVSRDLDGAGDDRPLYWQRLASLRAARPVCGDGLDAFEAASRGLADVIFDARSDVKVLVTGFDPFLLDRDVTQSNPSGVAALYLDDLRSSVGGRVVEIQSVVVPVRFGDFDDGLVEHEIVPLALRHDVDLLITVSMGGAVFALERFPGRRRSARAPDNRNVYTGGSAEAPVLPLLDGAPLAGPEFVEFTLPAAAMTEVEGRWEVRDNRSVTTLEDGDIEAGSLARLDGLTAVRGGGGGYLSNEISYRTLNALRGAGTDAPRSGHIHTPRIRGHDADAIPAIVRQVEALVHRAATADAP